MYVIFRSALLPSFHSFFDLIPQSLEIPGTFISLYPTASYCPCPLQLLTLLLSYANSVLQVLYFCSPFRDLVIQSTDISAPPAPHSVSRPTHPPTPATTGTRRKPGKPVPDLPSAPTPPTPIIPSAPPTLFSALRSLYVYISKNPADKGAVSPRAFIDKLRDGNELFRGAMHQDAHEFLNYLLNKIVEEIQCNKHHRDRDVSSSNDSREDCEYCSHVLQAHWCTSTIRTTSMLTLLLARRQCHHQWLHWYRTTLLPAPYTPIYHNKVIPSCIAFSKARSLRKLAV